jgi:hypothetical protein
MEDKAMHLGKKRVPLRLLGAGLPCISVKLKNLFYLQLIILEILQIH